MTQERWTAVDDYFTKLLIPADDVLTAALAASDAAELPEIQVAANQGKLLMLLAMIRGARTILEVGTLAAYSTIWMARALPADGHVVTLEAEPAHAKVARENLARAGLAERVTVLEGFATETLPKLEGSTHAPFDFIFIDADKTNNPTYFEWALKLGRQGTVIFVDNVVRDGEVINADTEDPDVQGVQRLHEMMEAEPRVTAAALQTVGSKGYDGFTLAVVTEG